MNPLRPHSNSPALTNRAVESLTVPTPEPPGEFSGEVRFKKIYTAIKAIAKIGLTRTRRSSGGVRPREIRRQNGPGFGRMTIFQEGKAVFRSGIPVRGTGSSAPEMGSEVNAES